MTPMERFKVMLGNALEHVCVLESKVEELERELAELKASLNGTKVEENV